MEPTSPMSNWCLWNVRGLGDPAKARAVKWFSLAHRVGFCCLLGTTIKTPRFASVFGSFGGDWECVQVYSAFSSA